MTRLFSSAVFQDLAKRGRSALFARLLEQTKLKMRRGSEVLVGDAFDAAFKVLKRAGRRDEYIYRAALTQNILLGRHSLNTASMLSEFRAGTCKADLVILNGTATVYEIKSERDSLTRLGNQLDNYRRVFAAVNVIASECHVAEVLRRAPPDVGVMCLSPRHHISTIRKAESRPDRVCSLAIFESLRTSEARAVLRDLNVEVPQVPNTKLHAAMRRTFRELEPDEVHTSMVRVLRRTRDLAPLRDLVENLPKSLYAAALSIQVRSTSHSRLVGAVKTRLTEAITWA